MKTLILLLLAAWPGYGGVMAQSSPVGKSAYSIAMDKRVGAGGAGKGWKIGEPATATWARAGRPPCHRRDMPAPAADSPTGAWVAAVADRAPEPEPQQAHASMKNNSQ